MMIMGGSEMSKTEYDLKAICILPMTYRADNLMTDVQYNGGVDYPATQVTT